MPLFHSNFHIRDSTAKTSIPIESWTNIMDFLDPDKGHFISAYKALRNPDIQSAVMQISGDLATAELKADATRAQGILNNPSVLSNARTFWVTMFAQMILGGEAFAYRWRNANGTDDHWEYLRPSQVQTFELSDGSGLVYNLSFDEPDIGLIQNVPQADVINFRLFSMNAISGFNPLYSLFNTLNIKNQSDSLTLKALSQAVTTNSVLQVPAKIDDKYSMARSKTLAKQLQTSGGLPVVLAEGETLTPLEIRSNISALLSQVDWTSTQVAKAFQIPDSYLNGQGDQQSSVGQIEGLYANTLNRDMNAVLSELNNKLNANVTADIRKAVDPFGNSYATALLTSKNLTADQVSFALQKSGYLPDGMPKAPVATTTSTTSVANNPPQEGENE
ncbi:HK97 family phage portal protein [Oenococcus oeni]|uniref:phage portal protein n=1 Tax=Oenococcus oeni TaxID=1247 RepID=UPI00107AC6D6|nr:phage portal protein [Oenococcus oeni]AVI94100.1 portal protein [Oenococcus oeni]SYV99703.1 HK97 family phage portal protein [Oenococcus oeni]SYW03878.1 HK97 family phage portal protein [Oenococcus oeni]SYW17656.1 HK97 family phage portal protein [Oenococcus oeni]VDC14619.1 HK97 family phage portal protein [Oenococcus oeni]